VLLDEATRDSVKELSAVLAGHHITVQDSGVTAMADRGVIGRIIGNLLINASKYSPMGSTIAVTFAADADTSRLAITDTGRGILPQDLERIFGEFERGDLAQSDGGTGLGLSSVRQLVALHGGKVWIESETGVGTTVTVELPAVA
jgi:signal transduction histidine kinase